MSRRCKADRLAEVLAAGFAKATIDASKRPLEESDLRLAPDSSKAAKPKAQLPAAPFANHTFEDEIAWLHEAEKKVTDCLPTGSYNSLEPTDLLVITVGVHKVFEKFGLVETESATEFYEAAERYLAYENAKATGIFSTEWLQKLGAHLFSDHENTDANFFTAHEASAAATGAGANDNSTPSRQPFGELDTRGVQLFKDYLSQITAFVTNMRDGNFSKVLDAIVTFIPAISSFLIHSSLFLTRDQTERYLPFLTIVQELKEEMDHPLTLAAKSALLSGGLGSGLLDAATVVFDVNPLGARQRLAHQAYDVVYNQRAAAGGVARLFDPLGWFSKGQRVLGLFGSTLEDAAAWIYKFDASFPFAWIRIVYYCYVVMARALAHVTLKKVKTLEEFLELNGVSDARKWRGEMVESYKMFRKAKKKINQWDAQDQETYTQRKRALKEAIKKHKAARKAYTDARGKNTSPQTDAPSFDVYDIRVLTFNTFIAVTTTTNPTAQALPAFFEHLWFVKQVDFPCQQLQATVDVDGLSPSPVQLARAG
jgi:hypothetical protein